MSKFTNLNNLDKLSKALNNRCKELIDEEKARALAEEQALQAEINVTKDMLGGKSIRYVTQAEYDALTEEEKDSSEITYFITDAVDLSHDHENKEFLDNLAARNIAIGNKSQSFDGVNDLVYSIEDIGAAPAEHSHDDKYYTESEIDLKLEDVNEAINGYVAELQSDIQTLESDKADKTYVDEQLSNVTNNGITEAELDLLLEEIFGINSKNELTSVRLGNYQMKYDNVNDTLDFIYNGVIDEPEVPPTTEEEIIPLVWAVGNLSGTDGSEKVQENSLRSSFAAIEDNCDYSFYLDTSFYDPSGVRVYFYDTNKTYISRTDGNVIGYVSGIYISIDVPTNAAYMRFKANAHGTTSVDTIGSLFTLRKTISYGEVVSVTWIDGKTISSGNIVDNAIAMLSDPITIDNNYNYTIRYNPTTTNEVRIVFYDSSQTFISKSDFLTSGNVDTVITFPQNTAYFRIKAEKVGITVNEANDNIIIKKVKKVGGYVTEGLSMYIDANDVATYGSIRDITGKQNITNHGASLTSDNKYLNFISSESDYIDTDLVPNLSTWSVELYFCFTTTPTSTEVVTGWGSVGNNKARLAYSGSAEGCGIQSNDEQNYILLSGSELLSPHHLIVTMNNGALTSYLDGVKTVLCASGGIQTSHTGTLKIGTKYDATKEFANINLRTFRFYDDKVLTDEEALQNYNYEINRCESIIAVTWKDGKSLLDNGSIVVNEQAVITDYIKIDNNYNYTINYTDKVTEVRLAYYDNNNTFILRGDYLTSGAVVEFPENTVYVRIKAEKVGITVNEVNDNIIFKKVLK